MCWHKSYVPDPGANAQVKEGSDPATFIELMKSGPSGWEGPKVPGSQHPSLEWLGRKIYVGNYGFVLQYYFFGDNQHI